jgi:hypothetical protein
LTAAVESTLNNRGKNMQNYGRSLAVMVTLLLLLLALVTGEAAASRSIVLNPAEGELGRVEARARSLTFTDSEASFSVICEVTRTLRLNRSIAKVAGAEVGSVTAIEVRNCRGGAVRFLTPSLPWSITYVSFTGTLPAIRELVWEIEFRGFLLGNFLGMAQCLYTGNVQERTNGRPINSLTVEEGRAVGLGMNLGVVECPAQVIIAGTLGLRPVVEMRLM